MMTFWKNAIADAKRHADALGRPYAVLASPGGFDTAPAAWALMMVPDEVCEVIVPEKLDP